MIREWNLHELARAVVEEVRAAHPDLTVELEHRGDGEGEWDGQALCDALESTLRAAARSTEGLVWVRTDAREEDPAIHVRWTGPLVDADFSAVHGVVERASVDGEARLVVRIPRR